MAYIGAEPVPGQNREVDDISSGFNGNATQFTLQVNSQNVSPESAKNILINLGGVLQNPDTDYTVNASTLTFTTAPASGLSFFGLILGAGINTATVADGAITTAKLASDAVGANQLANTSVTAGSYTTADITVDAQGRITAAASGTIANAEIADGAVNNAKVNASAAIAGTKISPDFGSQNIVTTGGLTVDTTTLKVDASNNRVGIGTASPAVNLDVSAGSGTTQIYVRNTATNGQAALGVEGKNSSGTVRTMLVKYDNNDSFRFATAQAVPLTFTTSDAERIRVTSDGKIGIGTTTPDQTLHVHKASAGSISSASTSVLTLENNTTNVLQFLNPNNTAAQLRFGDPQDNGAGYVQYDHSNNALSIGTAGPEKVRIDSSGNVGIGTSSPSQKLHLKDTAPMAQIESSSYNSFVGTAEANDNIGNGTKAGNLVLRGQTGIAISGNNGSATQVKIDADGLKFGTDTAAANALDDFEEGTWTPTAQYNTGSHVAVANAVCRYVKIGSLVHVSGRFSLTSDANGGSGELRIGGLPFTKNNPAGDGNSAGIQIYVEGAASNITNDITGLTLDGDTQFLVRRSGTTSSGNDFVGLVDAGTTLLVGGTYMSGQ